jgi:rhodanese-related sulfurtransferase
MGKPNTRIIQFNPCSGILNFTHHESTAYKLASVKRLSVTQLGHFSHPIRKQISLECRTGAHSKLALEASEKARPVTRNVYPKGVKPGTSSWRQLQPNRTPRFDGPKKGSSDGWDQPLRRNLNHTPSAPHLHKKFNQTQTPNNSTPPTTSPTMRLFGLKLFVGRF